MPTDKLLDHAVRLRGARMAIVAFLLGAVRAYPIEAQQPAAPQQPQLPATTSAVLAPYRAPVLALVQPVTGTVTQDKPVVVFRFATGEADDPLDVGSFVVAVDGTDRTALFHTTAVQAWGPLASETQLARGELAAGTHRVVARICSTRGACSAAEATLLVLPGIVDDAKTVAPDIKRSLLRRALGALGQATRKVLIP